VRTIDVDDLLLARHETHRARRTICTYPMQVPMGKPRIPFLHINSLVCNATRMVHNHFYLYFISLLYICIINLVLSPCLFPKIFCKIFQIPITLNL
jgi:hypothetical protein